MRIIRRIALAAIASVLLAFVGPAQAEKRVALVIGNSAYQHVPRLANPANDARLMAKTLHTLGFILVGDGPQLDLDETSFRRAVRDFGLQLQGADVGLFYFAGHAVEVRGSNYLVPVGANPTREADVDFQMLDANLVLRQMQAAGTKLNIVMLDACRNNPFAGRGLRSADGGLAQMQAPEGTLISFATKPGSVALDGPDGNSPYTKALAQAIRKPGLDIFRTFNEVGLAVKRATAGNQQPWVSSSPIKGEFYFAGRAIGVKPSTPITPPARIDPCAKAETHWKSAEAINSKSAFEDHLARFRDCAFANLAHAKVDAFSKAEEEHKQLPSVVPPAPPLETVQSNHVETVRAFYLALGSADGARASSLVIPEKRTRGPLSASEITKFYSSLAEPLRLVNLAMLSDGTVKADYT